MRHPLVCVLVTAALLVAACSGSGDSTSDEKSLDPDLSQRIAELDELPTVPAEDRTRQDRDPAAASAALWRLDPCRLIAADQGKPGELEQRAPHSCTLSIGETDVRVLLGTTLTTSERKQIGATNVRGAKAYVQPGGPQLGGCTAWLPVSGDQTIRIEDDFAGCWRVRPVLRRVVERIDAPSSRRIVPGMRAVETCHLLKHGLGSAMKGRKVEYGGEDRSHGFDHCVAIDADNDVAHTTIFSQFASLELETYQTQTLTFEEGASDTPTPDAYASSGWLANFGTIRGRAVFGSRGGAGYGCTMRWAESTTILHLKAKTCAQGKRFVRRMTKLLDNPPQRSVTPQKPLLYDSDGDDIGAREGCDDYLPLWFGLKYSASETPHDGPACHPYTESDVPDDPAEIVIAAEADPNVTCDLAVDAVRDEFGDRFDPATLDAYSPLTLNQGEMMPPPLRVRPCVFVAPRRQVQVQVFVSSDPMPVSRHQAEGLEETDTPTRSQLGAGGYGIGSGYAVGLGRKPDDPGFVAVFAGKRGNPAGMVTPYDGAPDALERVVDAIIRDHLAE